MSSFHHSKKGQFYILAALLLISYAFSLKSEVSLRKPEDPFKLLSESYISEGTRAINNAVYEDAAVTARFANYTDSYLAFAKSAEPGFRLAYLFRYRGQLVIGNRLGFAINATVRNSSYILSDGEDLIVADQAGAFMAALRFAGVAYGFGFSADDAQLKALFRNSDRIATRILVQG